MRKKLPVLTCALLVGAGLASAEDGRAITWHELQPGLELALVGSTEQGEQRLTVVRADPRRWELVPRCAGGEDGSATTTARAWAQEAGLAAATNAGMFATDYRSHVGLLQCAPGVVNQQRVNTYQSVAVYGPAREGLAVFRIHDLDAPGTSPSRLREQYRVVVQNLRLIKRPGENRWSASDRAWSEAALAEDGAGRMLFVFSRKPYDMRTFNRMLLSLPLDIVAAQHLEGGPEAQLYVNAGDATLDLVGSFETGFREDDQNSDAWPVPNLIGLRAIDR